MVGNNLVLLVLVDGPAASTAAFTQAEANLAPIEALFTTLRLRRLGADWGASQTPALSPPSRFTFAERRITLTLDPATLPTRTGTLTPVAAERTTIDNVWIDAALTELGFPGTPTNVDQRITDLANSLSAVGWFGLRVDDAFPVFITKYNTYWPAYVARRSLATISWPDITTGSFAAMTDRVIAHEFGHIFRAPDEYGSSNCTTSAVFGPFDTPNDNCTCVTRDPTAADPSHADCSAPNPATVDCLMKGNSPTLCSATPLHWGWADSDQDGVIDLVAQPTVTAVDPRAGSPGDSITITGRNLWDVVAVTFDTDRTLDIDYEDLNGSLTGIGGADPFTKYKLDTIVVTVPPTTDGIVTVNVETRAGASQAPLDDAWFLAAPSGVIPAPVVGPMVFFLEPNSGASGDEVAVRGANLANVTDVQFDGVSASITDQGSALIIVTAPDHDPGPVDVILVSPDGTSSPWLFSTFTYT
jgi:hypothetical protein